MVNNRAYLNWKYENKYLHPQEKEIADLLQQHDLKFVYHQPTYMYDLDSRPAIASPSFTVRYFRDLIVDYLPLRNTIDKDYKEQMYANNGLDAIVMTRAYTENQNWPDQLYKDIQSRLDKYS